MKTNDSKINKVLDSIKKWTEGWYSAYAILGLVSAALIPVLLPLMIISVSQSLANIAWVMGSFNLGLLTSPLWGNLADKKHAYHHLFFGGFIVLALGLAFFPFGHTLLAWLITAITLGAGVASVSTVATLFVVEFNPQNEWSSRIGWLQSFNGAGQTLGLLLAAFFSGNNLFNIGLWTGAALLIPAILVGHLGLPAKKSEVRQEHLLHHIDIRRIVKFGKVEFLSGGLIKHSHHINLAGLRNLAKLLPTNFGYFILSWFVSSLGVASFFAYFPIVMKSAYNVSPGLTSIIYAVAGAVGITLFTGSTKLSSRYGVKKIYRFGVLFRFIGFILLLILLHLKLTVVPVLASLGFVFIVLAWPILSVTGTTLTAELAPVNEGEAMGVFNASGAVATVLGTFLSGPLIHIWGYIMISILGCVGLGLSLILTAKIKTSNTSQS